MDSEFKGLILIVVAVAASFVGCMALFSSCDKANTASNNAYLAECVKHHTPLECRARVQ